MQCVRLCIALNFARCFGSVNTHSSPNASTHLRAPAWLAGIAQKGSLDFIERSDS